MKLFESAKFSKLAPARSWQLAPLGIPTGSCLHLPDCRQLPRHYSHFAATQCYCAQYFCDILCSISALQCAVFLRYNVPYFCVTMCRISALHRAAFLSYCAQYFARSAPLCITWVSINYGLLCPCAQCDRGSCRSWPMWICWALFTINSRCFCVCVKMCCGYRILMKREKAWRDRD